MSENSVTVRCSSKAELSRRRFALGMVRGVPAPSAAALAAASVAAASSSFFFCTSASWAAFSIATSVEANPHRHTCS